MILNLNDRTPSALIPPRTPGPVTEDTPLTEWDRACLLEAYFAGRAPASYHDLLGARTPRQVACLVARSLGRYCVVGYDAGVALATQQFPDRDYMVGSEAHEDSLVAEILRYLNDERPHGPSATGVLCYGPTEALLLVLRRPSVPEHNAAPLRAYLESGSEDALRASSTAEGAAS